MAERARNHRQLPSEPRAQARMARNSRPLACPCGYGGRGGNRDLREAKFGALEEMSQDKKCSCGKAHSDAVKHGIHKWRESISTREWRALEKRARFASRRCGVVRGMIKLLGQIKPPISSPDEVEAQMRTDFKRGYIQALRDVKREREKQEAASYFDAMQTTSKGSLREISHRFDYRK